MTQDTTIITILLSLNAYVHNIIDVAEAYIGSGRFIYTLLYRNEEHCWKNN